MVVGITFLLHVRGPRESRKKVVTTISHRTLFALADTATGIGRTTSQYDELWMKRVMMMEVEKGGKGSSRWGCGRGRG
jgi:hypothetical protein